MVSDMRKENQAYHTGLTPWSKFFLRKCRVPSWTIRFPPLQETVTSFFFMEAQQ